MCGFMIEYLPFDKRVPDTQYRDLLLPILTTGEEVPTEHGVSALKVIGHPPAEGTPFDQLRHLIEQVKERPDARHHELSPWIPQYVLTGHEGGRRVVVPPCHGWVHVHVNSRTRTLTLTHRQRSADAPVGL